MTTAVQLAQSVAPGVSLGFKNRIINGGMTIDQRNAGASVATSSGGGVYTLDRWQANYSQTSKYTVQQNAGSVTPPAGFSNYLGVTSTSSYSSLSTDYFMLVQRIEGFNTADLAFGTQNAKATTVSFWVYSSLTGTFSGAYENSANNRSYPFTYTISAANTWEYKTVTVPGDTTGTWVGATTGQGLKLWFDLGCGSNYRTTAGAWAAGDYQGATSSVSVVGTNGATWYITGVQLEVGTAATNFEFRDYGRELIMCQRYLPCYRYDGINMMPSQIQFSTTSASRGFITFPVTTRVPVTGMTISSASHFFAYSFAGGGQTATGFSMHQGGTSGAGIDLQTSASWTARDCATVAVQSSGGYVYFTGAEL